jgi:CCR4-NOT transcription complex subunit 1
LFFIFYYFRQPPEGLATILELLRSSHETGLMDRAPGGPGGPTALIHSGIAQARDYDDPHGLPEKTEFLLQEWVAMYHLPNAGRDSSKAFGHFVTQMSLHGVLKTDDLITRFFRLCTQFCVDISYRALASEPTADLIRSKAFHTLDAYVRLIALLIKHSGDASNGVTKVNLLNKVRFLIPRYNLFSVY